MRLKFLLFLSILVVNFNVLAICIHNETDYKLSYEIQNKNVLSPPCIKFYSGELEPQQKKCFAHSSAEGRDWQIFRKDMIEINKLTNEGGSFRVCTKLVEGILNTLRVSYLSFDSSWWCLDREDDR